jgi:hypothetical protein
LFFSAPAVYLVVWKPREGSQQGLVKEWIELIKRREPTAKILVVATHGGPKQRKPDIDRQDLWDVFGKDTVWISSMLIANQTRKEIDAVLKNLKRPLRALPPNCPKWDVPYPKAGRTHARRCRKPKRLTCHLMRLSNSVASTK